MTTAEQAVLKLAKKLRKEQEFYGGMPEFWSDYADEVVEYLEKVLRNCSAVPRELRPAKSKEGPE